MSTPSSILRLELIATGDQAGTWGNTTNTNLGTLLEGSIAGLASVSVTSANQALVATDYAADQARMALITLTTTTTANFNVYAPPVSKQYVIYNNSSYTATIYNGTVANGTTAAGTGVAIPAGKITTVWSNGTNFYKADTALVSLTTDVSGTLPVANGGTGATTFSSGQFLKGAGTSAVTTSATVALGSEVSGTLPIANGGTGATDAGTARTNLGLGSISTQASNNVSITGGAISGITDLAVADGGTGASSAANARTNLDVPSTTGSGASGTWGISISGSAASIADSSVTTAKIVAGAVTAAKLDGAQSGSAPIYAARAFVNFDGTSTVTIRNSSNVSSITDNGTGDYTVNFSTAMSDANFTTICTARYDTSTTATSAVAAILANYSQSSSSSVRVWARGFGAATLFDVDTYTVVVFR